MSPKRRTIEFTLAVLFAVAILAGDFLMARASEVASTHLSQEAVRLLATTYARLVEGQTRELRLVGNLTHSIENYFEVIGGKTATLISTSARLGAMAADAESPDPVERQTSRPDVLILAQAVISLEQFVHDNEPLAGDLLEGFAVRRSRVWFWRQVLLAIAIPAGIIGAVRQNSWADYTATSVAMVGVSIPEFFIGVLLLLVFFQKYFKRPIHFFGPLGIVSFLAGMAINLYLLVIKIMGEEIWGRPLPWFGFRSLPQVAWVSPASLKGSSLLPIARLRLTVLCASKKLR